jgi:hypothetical protein
VATPGRELRTDSHLADVPRMTSSAFPVSWLPAAIVRAAVVTPPAAQSVPTSGRHSAPELEIMQATASGLDRQAPGRHAEPEWSRQVFDALRDEDPFDWLGFAGPADLGHASGR